MTASSRRENKFPKGGIFSQGRFSVKRGLSSNAFIVLENCDFYIYFSINLSKSDKALAYYNLLEVLANNRLTFNITYNCL